MPNYSFTINSSFKPFSMQEMLVPLTMYKDAYDKSEEAYAELSDKTNPFKYLQDLPEDSKARQIYEGYTDNLSSAAEDLARNGLTLSNRRTLTNLKRRYSGEIGRLVKADEEMQKETELRRQMSLKDPTLLFAEDNLDIDQFLDKKKPNLYSVSGQQLYERGVQIGASDSARIWGNPEVQQLNDMFLNVVQSNGLSPELLNQWRNNLDAIPAFRDHLNATLKEYGVTDNLSGANLDRARQSVINGMINGAVYKRADNIQQNPDYIPAYQKEALAIEKQKLALEYAKTKAAIDAAGNSGGNSSKVPSITERTYISRGGRNTTTFTKSDDDYKDALTHGGPVHVEMKHENGKNYYELKGNSGHVYARLDPTDHGYETTVYTSEKEKLKRAFEQDFGTSFDDEYDVPNIKALGKKIAEIVDDRVEGPTGYLNYDFYLEGDNARGGFSGNNDAGGFYIDPHGRDNETRANGNPLAALKGIDPDNL